LREILKKTRDRCINASDWLNYGNQLWRFEQNEEAINAFEKAIALQSDFYQAYYGKGSALRNELKEYPKAIADFNQAIYLNPEDADAYGNRGLVYSQLGDRENAIADLEKAAQLFCQQGSFNDCQQAQELLRQLQATGN
jgi:tetratricopeptide (TPR) repeat protein